MAIQGIGAAGVSGISGAGSAQKVGGGQFSKTFKGQTGSPKPAELKGEVAPLKAHRGQAQSRVEPGQSQVQPARGSTTAQPARALEPAQMLDHVAAAQKRMEVVLELAQSGKSFTPAELISLQSQMYRASQELDLAGKVIEKATGGVKQILQTQV